MGSLALVISDGLAATAFALSGTAFFSALAWLAKQIIDLGKEMSTIRQEIKDDRKDADRRLSLLEHARWPIVPPA